MAQQQHRHLAKTCAAGLALALAFLTGACQWLYAMCEGIRASSKYQLTPPITPLNAAALCGSAAAATPCPALTVNFFPPGTTNVPAAWTREAQIKAGNEDTGSLNIITLAPKPTPRLYVQPQHPLFSTRACVPDGCLPERSVQRRLAAAAAQEDDAPLSSSPVMVDLALGSSDDDSGVTGRSLAAATCLTTVATPAAYDVLYNIDGGIDKKATMPPSSPPYIPLTTLNTLAPGKHTLNVKVTMLKGSGEVNSVSSMQPPTDQLLTVRVIFNLVDELPVAAPVNSTSKTAAAVPTAAQSAKPAVSSSIANASAAVGAAVAAAKSESIPEDEQAEADAVAAAAAVPAAPVVPSKYQCLRQYNVAGSILQERAVMVAGDDGIMECGASCNAAGSGCAGFKLNGRTCLLMSAFSTNSSSADATVDAMCMKAPSDWVDFGSRNAVLVGSGFYCLRGYDLKGDPAGSGDAETPVQTAATELTGMTPSTCGSACRSTTGCQYMLIKRPPAPGGTATCYLKMHALGGLYGNTGPSADVDLTCFNGQDTWLAFGGQLDHALPSPEVNIIAGVPSLASIAPIGLNANASGSQETYRCIKGYAVDGALLEQVAVPLGDEGLMQCAAKCNAAKPRGACVGYVMAVDGSCSMFGSIAFNTSVADTRSHALCLLRGTDWNKLGAPDKDSMYCLKNYDFAGDSVRTVDYATIATGAGAVAFCKQQCIAEPACQYVVTSLGKCYMRASILSGSAGATRPDAAVEAACIKGDANWALAALQVGASQPGLPAVPSAAAGGAALGTRRVTSSAAHRQWHGTPQLLLALGCSLLSCALAGMDGFSSGNGGTRGSGLLR